MRQAEEIFAAARTSGGDDCDLAILVGGDGGIHMLACADWQLESLRTHHGARAAYRVRRASGSVRLEARTAEESCVLAADRPERILAPPLADLPRYLMLQ